MNLFFVYVFIIYAAAHDGKPSGVNQVIIIIAILLSIEMVIGWALKWFCFGRGTGPVEQQIRLGICALLLYSLFVSLTAWQWTLLPSNVAVMALVRFILSSVGVIIAECAVWFVLYSCATECCPCLTLDDGARSLDDIAAEQEEKERVQREKEHREAVGARRAKMKKNLDAKLHKHTAYKEENEV